MYIDARTVLQHLPVSQYPGWALALALYLEGGIRACEIGSVMFGKPRGGGGETPPRWSWCGWRSRAACIRSRTSTTPPR